MRVRASWGGRPSEGWNTYVEDVFSNRRASYRFVSNVDGYGPSGLALTVGVKSHC